MATGHGRSSACPPDELHDLPVLVFGIVLNRSGWRIDYFGASTPVDELVRVPVGRDQELVVIAATTRDHFDPILGELARLASVAPLAIAGAARRSTSPTRSVPDFSPATLFPRPSTKGTARGRATPRASTTRSREGRHVPRRRRRRAWVRFGLLIGLVGLLVFLILFQQALQSGLLTSFVGAIRNQSAPVLVYSVDGQRVLQGGVITPDLEQIVRATPGIAEIGHIGQGTFTVTADGEPADATIIGYEREGVGSPRFLTAGRIAEQPGEAVASEADADDGFDIGGAIVVEPGGLELTVVGLAPDAQLSVTPTLFVGYGTYLAAVAARNPGGGDPLEHARGGAGRGHHTG